MRKTKMLAALLAGLITLSLAGCGADKTENTGSDPASAESGITATATDNASEPTAESSLPADSESKSDESTAEKEQAEGNAPADSGSKADTKTPAESNQQTKTPSKQTEAPKPAEEKPQTPAPTEKPEAPAETPTANEVARKTAEKLNALRQAQGSPAATILPGLGKVATYRSEQLITNFSHESSPDACAVLKYGEYAVLYFSAQGELAKPQLCRRLLCRGSGAVSNAESESQYRHRLSLYGQRHRRSGGEQENIRQALYTGHKTRNPRSRIQRLERGLIM